MKKKIIFLLTLLAGFASQSVCHADDGQTTKDVQYVYIEQTDGSTTKFALEEQPEFSFDAENLIVACQGDTLSFGLQGVSSYYFKTEQVSTSIQQAVTQGTPNGDVRPTIAFGEASFTGLKAGSAVTVYSINGQALATVKVSENGSVTVSLQQLPRGTYILRTSGKSFKIMNK